MATPLHRLESKLLGLDVLDLLSEGCCIREPSSSFLSGRGEATGKSIESSNYDYHRSPLVRQEKTSGHSHLPLLRKGRNSDRIHREGVVVNRRHRALDDRGNFVDFPFPSFSGIGNGCDHFQIPCSPSDKGIWWWWSWPYITPSSSGKGNGCDNGQISCSPLDKGGLVVVVMAIYHTFLFWERERGCGEQTPPCS